MAEHTPEPTPEEKEAYRARAKRSDFQCGYRAGWKACAALVAKCLGIEL